MQCILTVLILVKAETDANILLASDYGSDGYEIVIGGWDNTQSVIRDGKLKPDPGHNVTEVSIGSSSLWKILHK